MHAGDGGIDFAEAAEDFADGYGWRPVKKILGRVGPLLEELVGSMLLIADYPFPDDELYW